MNIVLDNKEKLTAIIEVKLKEAIEDENFNLVERVLETYKNLKEIEAYTAISDMSVGMKEAISNFVPTEYKVD